MVGHVIRCLRVFATNKGTRIRFIEASISEIAAGLPRLTATELWMKDDIRAMSNVIFSELESESIEILREVAATATKPVMLYSIGKDSSATLRLAEKGFLSRLDFPSMHIDTGWKFREMIGV